MNMGGTEAISDKVDLNHSSFFRAVHTRLKDSFRTVLGQFLGEFYDSLVMPYSFSLNSAVINVSTSAPTLDRT